MELKKLDKEMVITLFNERLIKDFTEEEIKPLEVILKAMDDGIYDFLGFYDGENIVGYTCLVRVGMNYLVDYVAIYPEQRNKGIGSKMLSQLGEYLTDACLVIVEVEDPDHAKDKEEKDLQQRRIEFYKRNGYKDTGLRVKCFGVPFVIMETAESISVENSALWATYQSFYRVVLPKEMFENSLELLA